MKKTLFAIALVLMSANLVAGCKGKCCPGDDGKECATLNVCSSANCPHDNGNDKK